MAELVPQRPDPVLLGLGVDEVARLVAAVWHGGAPVIFESAGSATWSGGNEQSRRATAGGGGDGSGDADPHRRPG